MGARRFRRYSTALMHYCTHRPQCLPRVEIDGTCTSQSFLEVLSQSRSGRLSALAYTVSHKWERRKCCALSILPFNAPLQMTFHNSMLWKSPPVNLLKSMSSCYATIIPPTNRFFACHDLIAETAAKATIDWCGAFGVLKSHLSDGLIHFNNETLRIVPKGLKLPYHFTLPYWLWSN